MRQTTVGDKAKRKVCNQCGATTWLRNQTTGEFSGPWHFLDCVAVPGGDVLMAENLEAKYRYEKEKRVPREQGSRVLTAIMAMLSSPSQEIMLQRKAAIQVEISKL